MKKAQRFNAGLGFHKDIESRRDERAPDTRKAFCRPCGTRSPRMLQPSGKTLGFCRSSLRDCWNRNYRMSFGTDAGAPRRRIRLNSPGGVAIVRAMDPVDQ